MSKVKDKELALKTSAAETSSTNGAGKDLGPSGLVRAVVLVTAVSGTSPTLDLTFADSPDNSTFTDKMSIPQITATGEYEAYFKANQRYTRYESTLGGTSPSFTYEIFITPVK